MEPDEWTSQTWNSITGSLNGCLLYLDGIGWYLIQLDSVGYEWMERSIRISEGRLSPSIRLVRFRISYLFIISPLSEWPVHLGISRHYGSFILNLTAVNGFKWILFPRCLTNIIYVRLNVWLKHYHHFGKHLFSSCDICLTRASSSLVNI